MKEKIMRKLTDHIVNPANDKITIRVIDEPGAGGANHEYEKYLDLLVLHL